MLDILHPSGSDPSPNYIRAVLYQQYNAAPNSIRLCFAGDKSIEVNQISGVTPIDSPNCYALVKPLDSVERFTEEPTAALLIYAEAEESSFFISDYQERVWGSATMPLTSRGFDAHTSNLAKIHTDLYDALHVFHGRAAVAKSNHEIMRADDPIMVMYRDLQGILEQVLHRVPIEKPRYRDDRAYFDWGAVITSHGTVNNPARNPPGTRLAPIAAPDPSPEAAAPVSPIAAPFNPTDPTDIEDGFPIPPANICPYGTAPDIPWRVHPTKPRLAVIFDRFVLPIPLCNNRAINWLVWGHLNQSSAQVSPDQTVNFPWPGNQVSTLMAPNGASRCFCALAGCFRTTVSDNGDHGEFCGKEHYIRGLAAGIVDQTSLRVTRRAYTDHVLRHAEEVAWTNVGSPPTIDHPLRYLDGPVPSASQCAAIINYQVLRKSIELPINKITVSGPSHQLRFKCSMTTTILRNYYSLDHLPVVTEVVATCSILFPSKLEAINHSRRVLVSMIPELAYGTVEHGTVDDLLDRNCAMLEGCSITLPPTHIPCDYLIPTIYKNAPRRTCKLQRC